MFDYQAGEKYKMTLILVGMAGVMVGMFFSILLVGDGPRPERTAKQRPKWADNPDVTGRGSVRDSAGAPTEFGNGAAQAQDGQAPVAPTEPTVAATDPAQAQQLVETFLPIAWDLSAGTAPNSQEMAMGYMTSDCADLYRQNIWTQEMATKINESGLKSTFQAKMIRIASKNPDGSVVVLVEGDQNLQLPDQPVHARPVKIEYLVKTTAQGMKIAGISEASTASQGT